MVKPGLLLLLVLCSTALCHITAQQDPAAMPEYALQALKYLNSVKLAGSDDLLSLGWKGEVPGRNWRRLATKLATPGSEVKIVAFGGSVTSGYYTGSRNTSWVYEVRDWLQITFPSVKFTLLNLGRASADVAAAAACWYRYMPPSTDLVFIEYSANGCNHLQCLSVRSPLVAGYESLIRRVIRNAPEAAIMTFAIFSFLPLDPNPPDPRQEMYPNPFYNTGEDMHYMVARRYGIPMASARDALYDIMYDDGAAKRQLGYTRAEMMLDWIHPAWLGHYVYGRGIVAYGMRQALTRELDALANGGAVKVHPKPLPRPISPLAAQQADGDTWCAEGVFFKDCVVFLSNTNMPTNSTTNSTADSFGIFTRWSRMHGMASGSPGRGVAPGSEVGVTSASDTADDAADAQQFKSESDWTWSDHTPPNNQCTNFNCQKYGYSANGAGKYLDVVVNTGRGASAADRRLSKQLLVIMFNREPLKRPGVGTGRAVVSCVQHCKCTDFILDGTNTDKSSQLGLASTEVSKNRSCRIRITILPSDGIRGESFKVMGIAVIPYTDSPSLTSLDYMLLAANSTAAAGQTGQPPWAMGRAAGTGSGILDVQWAGGNVPDEASVLELGL